MKSLIKSLGITLVLAIVMHIAIIFAAPRLVMSVAIKRIEATALETVKKRGMDHDTFKATNRVLHADPRTADTREVVAPNPDTMFTAIVYDVSEKPLLISTPVPDTYWSISFFADNTNNFYVQNDRQVVSNPARYLLVAKDMKYTKPENTQVVVAESNKGIILFRTLIKDKLQYKDLDHLRQSLVVEPVEHP